MKISRSLIALLAVSLSFCLLAQESEDDKKLDPALGFPTESENTAALPGQEDMPAALDEDKSKQISRYFDEALHNYEEILDNREEAELRATEKRIEANREMLGSQQGQLSSSETKMRQIKLEYLKRYLALKNSYEQGRIDKQVYYQQLDKLAREYQFQMETLKDDVSFYKDQSGKTDSRLKQLEELQRINKILMAQNPKPKKAENAQSEEKKRVASDLEMVLQRIKAAGCFKPQNVGQASDLR